ncbi:Flagellar hook protein FlgE [Anaerohalosphaera lusitana]|uniref:Flagellar hook protein FlgE n=1 Tax=Anaerohalosphaera lusitana TaxID=1936003 RepID=A0A1U9NGR2_9BACT|nr:flagellar hook-basal body complex protein [Anaerohalosphaera lusitana]AQT66924.1 Flagellar hook protein FlgE [Anaerohalosphaera lusitana]
MGALSTGVTGLTSHQKMLEVTGNNLANVNTTAFKSGQVRFAELLSQTVRKASAPTNGAGGTNPIQMGTGVGIASIVKNMNQGDFLETGQALDMAIEGEGYFVLNTGSGNVFTRMGSFAIDADSYLVDPATGYRLQRYGTAGESEGFQAPGVSSIKIPSDAAMPASATTSFDLSSNLRAVGGDPKAAHLIMGEESSFINSAGKDAVGTDTIASLQQFSGTYNAGDVIEIRGTKKDGTAVSVDWTVPAGATLNDLVSEISTAFGSGAADGSTASFSGGQISLKDDTAGYSLTDMTLNYVGADAGDPAGLELPGYFEMAQAGGNDVHNVNLEIIDSNGGTHAVTASFVRTDTDNQWDLVLGKLGGNVLDMSDRRIEGIKFDGTDGSFEGINDSSNAFSFRFGFDPATTQTVEANMGTVGGFDGLTQFNLGANVDSTATASNANGYEAGELATVAAEGGNIVGVFSNGIKKTIATVQMAVFRNPSGLESVGNGYYTGSGNSGDPVVTRSGGGGGGSIKSQKLEKSNVEIAKEFVNLIEAQNGYQANARTIKVANDVLRELTNIIR